MRSALAISPAGPLGHPRAMAELARMAEDAGWDAILVEDYLQHPLCAETHDPWLALAAMALATERVRLGLAVVPLPRRRPQVVARQALTLDHLSGGRLILGVGSGDPTSPDLYAFGEQRDARVRAQMLDEGLAVLTGLLSGEPFSFHGTHYQVEDVTFRPPPLQRPRVPIWIGGQLTRRGPRERAARFDGSLLYRAEPPDWVDITPDDVRAMRERAASVRGPDAPYDVCVGGRQLGEDLDAERAYGSAIAAAGATWRAEFIPPDTEPDELRHRIARGPLRSG